MSTTPSGSPSIPPCGPSSVARGWSSLAASTSEIGRFETETLATDANLEPLMDLSGEWIDQVHQRKLPDSIILDMDSSVSETYGQQEGSAYNGHFGCTCYHPLFLFNQFGDLERCLLRRGNVHSAKYWRRVLLPVIARYRELDVDPSTSAATRRSPSPRSTSLLEARGLPATRSGLQANPVLERKIAHLLKRPVGRPSQEAEGTSTSFRYRAKGWTRARRVVAKVEWHAGELYPARRLHRHQPEAAARRGSFKFYNGRGTAEQWIKEGKNAVKWTKLSCQPSRTTRCGCSCSPWRTTWPTSCGTLALPKAVEHWTLTTLREKLVKIGAKVVRHGRYVVFQLAEVAVPRAAVRGDPGADRPAQAQTAADRSMSTERNELMHAAGEVRP